MSALLFWTPNKYRGLIWFGLFEKGHVLLFFEKKITGLIAELLLNGYTE